MTYYYNTYSVSNYINLNYYGIFITNAKIIQYTSAKIIVTHSNNMYSGFIL